MLETIIEELALLRKDVQANTKAVEAETVAVNSLAAAINQLNGPTQAVGLSATLGGVKDRPPGQ